MKQFGRWFIKKGRGAVFVGTPNYFLKLFPPFGHMRYRRRLELNGNREALSDHTWSEFPVEIRGFPCGFLLRRGDPITDKEGADLAEAVLWERVKRPLDANYLAPARFLIPLSGLEILRRHGVSNKNLEFLLSFIDDLRIPAGSSHGDAHQDNCIKVEGKIRVIDWTVFEEHSSPLFDLLYWYSDSHRRELAANGHPPTSLHDQVLTVPPNWRKLEFAFPDITQLQIYFVLMRVIIKFKAKRNPLKRKNERICAPLLSLIDQLKQESKYES